jgi:Antitoxin VbhA
VSRSESRHDAQDEPLTKFDPEPAGKEAAERQHAATAALAPVQAEGLEPGAEDLALFAEVACGRLPTDELRERVLSRSRR